MEPQPPSEAPAESAPSVTLVTSGSPNKRLRLVVLLLALAAGPLLAEALLRTMIFSSSNPGDPVRDPRRYADPGIDDDFYKLQYLLADTARRRPPPGFDPVMGWVGHAIEPQTYNHRDEGDLAGRRPVLLYGASYAQCAASLAKTDCFQHAMAASDLADNYGLLNYGVGNSGLGQTYLMMQHTLDRFAERKPVVVIGLVLETDFDRAMLSFRGWAKPHFSLTDDGGLSLDGPVSPDTDAYLEEHPVDINSYLWRLIIHGGEWLPQSLRQMLSGAEQTLGLEKELVTRLVVGMQGELASRNLEGFFILFCRKEAVRSTNPVASWQHDFVPTLLDDLGIPYVEARTFLQREGSAQGRDPTEFFIPDGPDKNHPTAEANQLMFQLIRHGLEGTFDGGDR